MTDGRLRPWQRRYLEFLDVMGFTPHIERLVMWLSRKLGNR